MPLDAGQRPVEEHPANHQWYEIGSDVVCMEVLMDRAHPRETVMPGNMVLGAKNIWKKREEEGK